MAANIVPLRKKCSFIFFNFSRFTLHIFIGKIFQHELQENIFPASNLKYFLCIGISVESSKKPTPFSYPETVSEKGKNLKVVIYGVVVWSGME